MSVVRQNYSLALGVNSIGLYLAAAGSINPIGAALLHNLSTILVVFKLAPPDPLRSQRNPARIRARGSLVLGVPMQEEVKTYCA